MARKKNMSRHYEDIYEELIKISIMARDEKKYKEAIAALQLANFVCITEASMSSDPDSRDIFISNKLSNGIFMDYFEDDFKEE